jgi:hypothetical protein
MNQQMQQLRTDLNYRFPERKQVIDGALCSILRSESARSSSTVRGTAGHGHGGHRTRPLRQRQSRSLQKHPRADESAPTPSDRTTS